MTNLTSLFRKLRFLLLIIPFSFVTLAGQGVAQEKLPETKAGKRLGQVIEVLDQTDAAKRTKLAISIFSKDDDPDELGDVAKDVQDQTAGIVFQEALESTDLKIVAVCKANAGPLLRITLEVEPGDENRIANISFRLHGSQSRPKAVGDLMPVFNDDGKTLPAARGVWLAKGYGYVCEITEDNLSLYEFTGKYGWKLDDDEDFANLLFKVSDDKDKSRITFHPSENGFSVVRLDKLPAPCLAETEWTPVKLFDLFDSIMQRHYPFFEVRKFDWNARVSKFKPLVNDDMSESELFEVFGKMLDGLQDAHTRLAAEIDGEERVARSGNSKTISRLKEAFEKLPEPKSKSEFSQAFFDNFEDNIMSKILRGEGQKTGANTISWGFANDDKSIGYIHIGGMGGFALGDTDTQLKALHKSMNEILAAFAETKAVIVDISMNGGGSDIYSIEIASHFADKERIGFSKWPAKHEEYRQDRKVIPYSKTDPKGTMYLKPVYLVTNDYSVSAAEIFTMCMRALPNVTTVGESTSGALSDVLNKTLPNGWVLMTSNEIYVDHEGVCHEGPGIPPQIKLDIFDPVDISKPAHHKTIAKVVKLALEAEK